MSEGNDEIFNPLSLYKKTPKKTKAAKKVKRASRPKKIVDPSVPKKKRGRPRKFKPEVIMPGDKDGSLEPTKFETKLLYKLGFYGRRAHILELAFNDDGSPNLYAVLIKHGQDRWGGHIYIQTENGPRLMSDAHGEIIAYLGDLANVFFQVAVRYGAWKQEARLFGAQVRL